MQRQHHLEIALEKSISLEDSEETFRLIENIQKSKTASLFTFDAEGKSFLFQALEEGNKSIADRLLVLQKECDEIIFKKDQKNRNLLHMAIAKRYINIAAALIENAKNKQQIEIYLEADNESSTVLHYASDGNSEIIELILEQLSNEFPYEFINYVNQNGDTALHLALKHSITNHSIAALINHGAKLNLRNDKQETPFKFFSLLDKEKQEEIFCLLNQEKQKSILKPYRILLIENPQSETLKNIYFKLTGLYSFQDLLIAHHEFNPKIPIRNPRLFNEDLLESMPLYTKKIISHIEQEKPPILKPSSNTEMLDEDRVTLSRLIDDIENYLASLHGRPTISTTNKVLAVLIPIINALFYIGLETFFIYKYKTTSKDHFNLWRFYDLSVTIFGSIGSCFTLLASVFAPVFLWNKETNVSNQEWKVLVDQLQENIVQKLQILEEKEKISNQLYLPTPSQNIRELENDISTLTAWQLGDFFTHTLPISEAIVIFSRLKNILEILRHDLNLSKKPISLFFQPEVRVDDPEDSEYDSEDDLLPKVNRRV